MFFILKAIFTAGLILFLLTFITGLSLAMRLRNHLQNPFNKPQDAPPPPPGKGDVIEGEYQVLDDKGSN